MPNLPGTEWWWPSLRNVLALLVAAFVLTMLIGGSVNRARRDVCAWLRYIPAGEWWVPLIRGSLALLFAAFAFGMPIATTGTLALVIAGYLQSDAILAWCTAWVGHTTPIRPLRFELLISFIFGYTALGWLVALLTRLAWPDWETANRMLIVLGALTLAFLVAFLVIWSFARRRRCPALRLIVAALMMLPTLFLLAAFVFGPLVHWLFPRLDPFQWWSLGVFPDGFIEFIYGLPALHHSATMPSLRRLINWALLWSLLRGGLLLWNLWQPPATPADTAGTDGRRARYGGWFGGLAGLMTLLWGVLLRFNAEPEPFAFMAWSGVYLLLFGAIMVAFALRLKTQPQRADMFNPFAKRITLRRIARGLFRMTEFVATAAVAAAVIALLYVFVAAMQRQTIDIGTIAVPKMWEERGYTSAVAAARLRGAINQVVADADSHSPSPRFGGAGPEITLYEMWFQPEAIAGWLGTWLGLRQQQDVSGEITSEGCNAQLRLRYNGSQLPVAEGDICADNPADADWFTGSFGELATSRYDNPPGYLSDTTNSEISTESDWKKVDTLFVMPADEVLRRTNPYLLAAACEPYHLTEANKFVDLILGTHQPHQSYGDVAWAYNLRGLIYERQQRLHNPNFTWTNPKLLEDYERSFDVSPHFLGDVNKYSFLLFAAQEEMQNSEREFDNLRWEARREKAERYRRDAQSKLLDLINYHPRDPNARVDRAELMRDANPAYANDQYQLAVALGQRTIDSDPDNFWAYVLTGEALFALSEFYRHSKLDDLAKENLHDVETALSRAVALNNQSFEARLLLGAAYYHDYNQFRTGIETQYNFQKEIERARKLDPCDGVFDKKQTTNLNIDFVDKVILDAVADYAKDHPNVYFGPECPEGDLPPDIAPVPLSADVKRPRCPAAD